MGGLLLLLLLLRASVPPFAPATVRIRSCGRLGFCRGFLLRPTVDLVVSIASAEAVLAHGDRLLLYASMLSGLRCGCKRRLKLALFPQTSDHARSCLTLFL